MLLAQGIDFRPEDDGVVVPVGVEQPNVSRRGRSGRFNEREHRGDAAAGTEGHHVAVAPELKEPGGASHLNEITRRHVFIHPIRDHAVGRPLDRDAELGVDRRGRGHGVAPDIRLAVHPDPEGAELPGLVREVRSQLGGHIEDERTGLGGLGHHPAHPNLMKPVVTHAGRVSHRFQECHIDK